MKTTHLLAAFVLSVLAVAGLLGLAANEPEQTERRAVAVTNLVPLKLGSSIPLAIQSPGVAWKGNTFHLVGLGSITFDASSGISV